MAVTVSGIVAVLIVHAHEDLRFGAASQLGNPRIERLNQVMMIFTLSLVALAAVNALLVTWAMVVDTRRSAAVARSLGATPGQVSAGLSGAQMLPALAGALLGIPGGFGLIEAVRKNAGSVITTPPGLVAGRHRDRDRGRGRRAHRGARPHRRPAAGGRRPAG